MGPQAQICQRAPSYSVTPLRPSVYSDVTVELPFTLTHPKPPDEMTVSAVARPPPSPAANNTAAAGDKDNDGEVPVDPDLIHIDTRYGIVICLAPATRVFSHHYRNVVGYTSNAH